MDHRIEQDLLIRSSELTELKLKPSTLIGFGCGIVTEGLYKGWFAFPCIDPSGKQYLGFLNPQDRTRIVLPKQVPNNYFTFPASNGGLRPSCATRLNDPIAVLQCYQTGKTLVYCGQPMENQ